MSSCKRNFLITTNPAEEMLGAWRLSGLIAFVCLSMLCHCNLPASRLYDATSEDERKISGLFQMLKQSDSSVKMYVTDDLMSLVLRRPTAFAHAAIKDSLGCEMFAHYIRPAVICGLEVGLLLHGSSKSAFAERLRNMVRDSADAGSLSFVADSLSIIPRDIECGFGKANLNMKYMLSYLEDQLRMADGDQVWAIASRYLALVALEPTQVITRLSNRDILARRVCEIVGGLESGVNTSLDKGTLLQRKLLALDALQTAAFNNGSDSSLANCFVKSLQRQ